MEKIDLFNLALREFLNICLQHSGLPRISQGRPHRVDVGITNRCQLRCKFCDLWQTSSEELSGSQWKHIIWHLRCWLGPFRLGLAGGEPLLRKDLLELISYSNSLGILTSLVSNGLLINAKMAKGLAEAGLDNLSLSLDSLKEEVQDELRGHSGAFKKIMSAFEYLKPYRDKINISIATVICSSNIEELKDLVLWTKGQNLTGISFQILGQNYGQECDSLWYKSHPLWIQNLELLDKALNELIELKKAGHRILNHVKHLELMKFYFKYPDLTKLPENLKKKIFPCRVGRINFRIDPNGGVQFCNFMPYLGSLQEKSPDQIWRSSKAEQVRKQILNCRLHCVLQNCNFEQNLSEKFKRFSNKLHQQRNIRTE